MTEVVLKHGHDDLGDDTFHELVQSGFDDGFDIQHPLRERIDGELFDCGPPSATDLARSGAAPAGPLPGCEAERRLGRRGVAVAGPLRPPGGEDMSGDPWHPEGIYQCNGCGRTYLEYVNGCVEDHGEPRKVALVLPDLTERTNR